MDTLLDTDGPVIVTVAGGSISIPKATNRDYLPWLAEIHGQWKEAKTKLIPPTMLPKDRFEAGKQIEKEKPTQWDLIDALSTGEGVDKVLGIVCAKLKPEEAAKIMALPQVRQYEIAARSSGLIPELRLSAMFGPTMADLEQNTLNMLHPFWQAMKAKGIAPDKARAVMLELPGVTAEMINGKPSSPETPQNGGQPFGGAGGNG